MSIAALQTIRIMRLKKKIVQIKAEYQLVERLGRKQEG